jgi:hypothetical protein
MSRDEAVEALARPPVSPLGERLTVSMDIGIEDRRRRDRDAVADVLGPWVARQARRILPGYHVEGWSANVYPGRTYIGWWFGSVEVYMARPVLDDEAKDPATPPESR